MFDVYEKNYHRGEKFRALVVAYSSMRLKGHMRFSKMCLYCINTYRQLG